MSTQTSNNTAKIIIEYCPKCDLRTQQRYLSTGCKEDGYQYSTYRCTECGFENSGLEEKIK